jgi:hypothetical protein
VSLPARRVCVCFGGEDLLIPPRLSIRPDGMASALDAPIDGTGSGWLAAYLPTLTTVDILDINRSCWIALVLFFAGYYVLVLAVFGGLVVFALRTNDKPANVEQSKPTPNKTPIQLNTLLRFEQPVRMPVQIALQM